jgi:hypothetical protein
MVAGAVLLRPEPASANGGDPWIAGGNSAAATDTLGTANAQPLVIVAGGVERMRIDPADGRVGIGTSVPSSNAQLHVKNVPATRPFTARFDNAATNGVAVIGVATGAGGRGVTANASGTNGSAVAGYGVAPGTAVNGVYGESQSVSGIGVKGVATAPDGTGTGVYGQSTSGTGVRGESGSNIGVLGHSVGGTGVEAVSQDGYAVFATSQFGPSAVRGETAGSGDAVVGSAGVGAGVFGLATTGVGVYGFSATGNGMYGVTHGASGYSGFFEGGLGVRVDGNLATTGVLSKGSGTFRIDHPQDPANRFLVHSFVESPEMKNVYDGVIVCDANGEAVVELPSYFEALNRTFRYQLTCVGKPSVVYIADEITDGRFRIAGGLPGLKVSWMITGVRQDVFAEANPVVVEPDKSDADRGMFLHPELFGHDETRRIGFNFSKVTVHKVGSVL